MLSLFDKPFPLHLSSQTLHLLIDNSRQQASAQEEESCQCQILQTPASAINKNQKGYLSQKKIVN